MQQASRQQFDEIPQKLKKESLTFGKGLDTIKYMKRELKILFQLRILLGVLLASNIVVAQSLEGTLIMMVICQDGIVIASDSRAVIKGEGNYLAYIDGKEKSFEFYNYVVAFAGRSFMWNTPLYEFLHNFPKGRSSKGIQIAVTELVDTILRKGDKKGISNFLTQTSILIAGYEDDIPYLCKTSNGVENMDCSQSIISNMVIPEAIKLPLQKSKMDGAISILSQIFIENESISMSIGGQTKFWKINQSDKTPKCVFNCDYSLQLSLPEYYQKIINDAIAYNIIVPFSEEYLKEYLKREINRIAN